MYCKRCGRELEGTACPHCRDVTAPPTSQRGTPSVFLEPDEECLAEMSSTSVSSFGGGSLAEYVVLSDRRIYYAGSAVGMAVGAGIRKTSGQVIVPLEHVTSIHCLRTSNLGLLIASVILGVTGMAVGVIFADYTDGKAWFAIVPALVLLVAYLLSIHRYFTVCSPSGSVGIDFRVYGEREIAAFARRLGAALTAHRERSAGDGAVRP